jgi:hypothetical protein
MKDRSRREALLIFKAIEVEYGLHTEGRGPQTELSERIGTALDINH